MMAFYRSLYGAAATDEEQYLAHRLALASQSEIMDLSRLSRGRGAGLTSSLIRYAPPRGAGMFQEINPVYGDHHCPTSQPSFDSDDGLMNPRMNQVYRSYPFGDPAISSQHSFDSSQSIFGSSGDVTQLSGNPQHMLGIQTGQGYVDTSEGSPMPGTHPHDLPAVVNRPELQWLVTTSNVDIRTLTPPNTVSSPHVGMPPQYNAQPGSPSTQVTGHRMIDDRSSSSVTISHHHLLPRYQNVNEQQVQHRAPKRAGTLPGQKPKGTPGRKRKVLDHELTPAEANKRHVRRERNKVAAAKCRNRRRELTDRLQGETDNLEENQNILHQEILSLQQEKEHLEFILATHATACKARMAATGEASLMQHEDTSMLTGAGSASSVGKISLVPPPEVMDDGPHGSYFPMPQPQHGGQAAVVPVITATPPASRHGDVYNVSSSSQVIVGNPVAADLSLSAQSFTTSTHNTRFPNITLDTLDPLTEAPLNTPVCTLATPSVSTGVFTFPSTPCMTSSTATTDTNFAFSACSTGPEYIQQTVRNQLTPYSANLSFSTIHGHPQHSYHNCAAAHRRSSSSEQSPDSVQSPKLLAL